MTLNKRDTVLPLLTIVGRNEFGLESSFNDPVEPTFEELNMILGSAQPSTMRIKVLLSKNPREFHQPTVFWGALESDPPGQNCSKAQRVPLNNQTVSLDYYHVLRTLYDDVWLFDPVSTDAESEGRCNKRRSNDGAMKQDDCLPTSGREDEALVPQSRGNRSRCKTLMFIAFNPDEYRVIRPNS